jgi:hypothetical protein
MYDINVRYTVNLVAPILEKLINSGKRNFGIYTYGNIGQFIDKEILQKQYGIYPKLIIDNKSFNGKTILNLEQAKVQSDDNIVYLVCSDNKRFYDEIRSSIYATFPLEQVVDLFSERPNITVVNDDDLNNVFTIIEGWIDDLEYLE